MDFLDGILIIILFLCIYIPVFPFIERLWTPCETCIKCSNEFFGIPRGSSVSGHLSDPSLCWLQDKTKDYSTTSQIQKYKIQCMTSLDTSILHQFPPELNELISNYILPSHPLLVQHRAVHYYNIETYKKSLKTCKIKKHLVGPTHYIGIVSPSVCLYFYACKNCIGTNHRRFKYFSSGFHESCF